MAGARTGSLPDIVKDELCKAFCDQLRVREVPAGLAISTAFSYSDCEPLGFYVVGPDALNRFRIEDDGTTIPLIEADGIDLETTTRQEAMAALLTEYDVHYDADRGDLTTPPLTAAQVPSAAFKFVALLLRLQDLILLTPERAASTFREDATKAIRESLGARAVIKENEPIAPADTSHRLHQSGRRASAERPLLVPLQASSRAAANRRCGPLQNSAPTKAVANCPLWS
jgi:hypothetical protein